MDNLKLFAKMKMNSRLIQIIRYCQDIGIEFGKEKCALKKNGKRKIKLNQERIRTLGEKENYKYFGILETDTIKQAERK